MESVQQPALVVGEALVDVVVRPGAEEVAFAGGSALNAAVALSRLGRTVRFATCFADDEYGAMVRRQLDGAGVALASDPAVVTRTSSARATIGADGAASYEFDLDWRLGQVADVQPVVVQIGSLGAVLAPGADDVRRIATEHRETATIGFDINARPVVTGVGPELVARVESLAALADVVKASDEDLTALWPQRDIRESARALLELGPAAVVVTMGHEGSHFVAASGASGDVPAPSVTVVDTIGAGDTFGAALFDGLWGRELLGADRRAALRTLDDAGWREVCAWAARAAAVTVSRPGADPPYRCELD